MGDSVSHVLGLKKQPASALEMALVIRKGLPAFSLAHVCNRFSLEEQRLAGIVGLPPKSVSRLRRVRQRRPYPTGCTGSRTCSCWRRT